MTNDPEQPKPPTAKPDDKTAKQPPAAPSKPAPPVRLPGFDERRLELSELAPFAGQLDADALVAMARDGRATVRCNAALALAAVGYAAFDFVMLVRDSDFTVATAAAEAIGALGTKIRPLIPQLVSALDGAQPEVLESVVDSLARLIGSADDELIAALDVPQPIASKTVLAAAGKAGKLGVAFLVKAGRHERSRIRINAISGLGRLGKIDPDPAMAYLSEVESADPIPDARTAAKHAMLAIVAREKRDAVDSLPNSIPEFEARKLSKSELAEHAHAIDVDEMIHALRDGRAHVKINAARCLAIKGESAARAAGPMGLLLRDSVDQVRREVALALARLGSGAIEVASDLVAALGDSEPEVGDAAAATLAAMGTDVADALVRGLDAGEESHGLRVGELINALPRAAEILTEAFKSPAINVQVNAALALGLLRDRVGVGLAALHGARTGGDGRTREAVRRALEWIEPKRETGPKPLAIAGFEDRFLDAAELANQKPALDALGVADLVAYLQDGRDVVRANAATALAVFGQPAAGAASSLGLRLRDDAPRVRLAAAAALDKLGDPVVIETANDLVGALRDADDKVAEACAEILRARKALVVGALVRGLDSDERHGRRIALVINALPDASDVLRTAFGSPAVNVQVNAALGLGLLGANRIGNARAALEGARTGGDGRTRDAVRKALEALDGPRRSGPSVPELDGFEIQILAADAFKDTTKLRVDDLLAYAADGRAVVRANVATALGALGAVALAAGRPLAVLLRDDDARVRIAAAGALDKLGDDVVREVSDFLVGALRGDAEVAAASAAVLAPRKARVLTALLKGLETDDEDQARRIVALITALPDACEILCDAIDSPAENVQVNAAIGIGTLGANRAGVAGRKALETRRTGGLARTREAVFKGLAMLNR